MAGGRFCFQLLLHELMAVIILISKRMAAIALGFLLLHSGLIILGDVGGIVQRHCPEKERHALISFKRELIDDFGMLSSWATHHDDVHNKNCCDWRGVLCNYSTGHVIALQLPGSIQNPLSPGPVLRRLGGLGLGFVVGFWGVCGTLVLNTSWRIAYFRFLNNMKDKLFVMVAIYSTRFGRRIQALNGHA
ncbi:receptor-like protein EIX2 isoform X2 [Malania oleifera]|uniref:receptor-like protein EIX2 isoform X2 n=1 Tax=Malania oleifera TaxID=397392 RepID=UPI0025ADE23E|nr:receptor-like protein EIX2 isoform X2 [Malania oleifera]